MRTQKQSIKSKIFSFCFVLILLFSGVKLHAETLTSNPAEHLTNYTEFKGSIVDKKTGEPLAYASMSVIGTNITIVSNSEGQFLLKLPTENSDTKILVSFIGYKNKQIALSELKQDKHRIELERTSVQLPELSVSSKDASELIRTVLEKKGENYYNTNMLMTAFYRETIKKNRSYASLSEAVVEINKQPYSSNKTDIVRLFKSRKQTDYNRLDTLTFKLMGGPFNSLYLDVMKYPEVIFTDEMMANYEFTFDKATYMDNQLIYIVDFKQRANKSEPLYFGKLYIVAKSMALKTAVFSLNITDKEEASKMFIMKKPLNAKAFPYETKYRIDYREIDGKWYYGYSRIELGIKIVWKKRLFNTNYSSTVEMAVTDWGKSAEKKSIDFKDRIKPSIIISDEANGFTDPQFWGEFNVIEPEKSIETAIKKIQKQLEKK